MLIEDMLLMNASVLHVHVPRVRVLVLALVPVLVAPSDRSLPAPHLCLLDSYVCVPVSVQQWVSVSASDERDASLVRD